MRIDGIVPIDPIQPDKKPSRIGKLNDAPNFDTVNISKEAARKAEILAIKEMVAAAPDVRMDRVEELRAKINDPSYLNEKVINATADKIIDQFYSLI